MPEYRQTRMSVLLMKTLYFDCFAGASGDMILGALVAAGVEPRSLQAATLVARCAGYSIDFETVDRSGISATYARVQLRHEHAHRHLSDILKIIYDSRLSDAVKDRAAKIFSRLAEARREYTTSRLKRSTFTRLAHSMRSSMSWAPRSVSSCLESSASSVVAVACRQRHG